MSRSRDFCGRGIGGRLPRGGPLFFPAWTSLSATWVPPVPSELCFPHRIQRRMARRGVVRKSREWVLEKKERRRRQGK